jgi:hypothetical protein
MPAAVAISAATTFERMPPEPERGGLVADRELLQRGEVHDLGTRSAGRGRAAGPP